MYDKLTRRRMMMSMGPALAAAGAMFRPGPACAASETWGNFAGNMARIEHKSGGRLGVAIIDTGTGQRYRYRGDERFPMCSTSKLLECGAVLARVDAGRETLNRRIRFSPAKLLKYSPVTRQRIGGDGMTLGEICAAALTLSDNTAANLILGNLGGPAAVTAFARSLGDRVTRLDRTEPMLNEAVPGDPRDTTTPNAMAADLRMLTLGNALSPRSRNQLTAWLVACRTGGAKLRAGVPKSWRVGDKTGNGDHGTTNDIAVFWPPGHAPLIICVYLTEATASFDDCDTLIAKIGHTVAAALTA
jgi:beta-lactamase class A